jgi:hypothetical protein
MTGHFRERETSRLSPSISLRGFDCARAEVSVSSSHQAIAPC